MNALPYPFSLMLVIVLVSSCKNGENYRDEIYQKPSIDSVTQVVSLSPQESIEKIYLPTGYSIQLVASEPMIGEPVTIAWDGDGNMYVAEMLTYMQNIDGINEDEPWSRISLLKDTNGDGVMDIRTTFIDSLVLPRILLPLDDRVIVGETYKRNIYSFRDTDADGVADEKITILEDTVTDRRNLEHQDANMLWSIDNWLYVSNKAFRYRFIDNKLIRDTMPEPGPGQWGLTQDETGRLFFSRAGAEIPALGFQQHPSYGGLDLKDPWDSTFLEPWPLLQTMDVQGGIKRIRRTDKTLNRFTAVAGQEIFLGDKMPGAYGDLFIPEPVGRLVRRAKVKHIEGKIRLENAYHEAEFLASTDPLFRPVQAATGPDGALYIVDMYRGIIQEGNWVKEGSYLRQVVKEKGFDQFSGKGRIYRIIHEDMKPGDQPRLLNKSARSLLDYLSHKNGWWRMNAQKLIILKNDHSVVPKLKKIVESNESFLTGIFGMNKNAAIERLHALWTLEGLDAIDKEIILIALRDEDYRVRTAALRISERFLKQNDSEIENAVKELAKDSDPEVLQQFILTSRMMNEESKPLVKDILERYKSNELIKATGEENLNPSFSQIQALKDKFKLRGGDAASQVVKGYKIFQENCSACHGSDGKGIVNTAPPLVGSPRLNGKEDLSIRILLHGLIGPVDGKQYSGPMAPVARYSDEEIANIASYIRAHLNDAGTVWRGNVRTTREKYKDRDRYWTLEELKESAE